MCWVLAVVTCRRSTAKPANHKGSNSSRHDESSATPEDGGEDTGVGRVFAQAAGLARFASEEDLHVAPSRLHVTMCCFWSAWSQWRHQCSCWSSGGSTASSREVLVAPVAL